MKNVRLKNSDSISIPYIVFNDVSDEYRAFLLYDETLMVSKSNDLLSWSDFEFLSIDVKGYSLSHVSFFSGKYYFVIKKENQIQVLSSLDLVSFEKISPYYPVEFPADTCGENLYFDKNGKMWLSYCQNGNISLYPYFDNGKYTGTNVLFMGRTILRFDSLSNAQIINSANGKLYIIVNDDSLNSVECVKSDSGTLLGPWFKSSSSLFKSGNGLYIKGRNNSSYLAARENEKSPLVIFELEETEEKLSILNEITGDFKNTIHNKYEKQIHKPHWAIDLRTIFRFPDMNKRVDRAAIAYSLKNFLRKKFFK